MTMDLILWRHAEAEDLDETDENCGGDLSRRLTHRGEKHAARMAAWLDRQLPQGTRIWASPAVRTEQTVLALGRKYRLHDQLRPTAGQTNCCNWWGGPPRAPRPWWSGTSPPWVGWRRASWGCGMKTAPSAKGPCGGCASARSTAACKP